MEYLKHLAIRTPFQKPLEELRFKLNFRKHHQNPELTDIYLEPFRIEEALNSLINRSSNCIDVGAHLGSMLSQILEIAPNGRHLAIEAIPYKADWLKRKFPEVDVKQIALGNTKGELTFYINPSQSGFSGIYPNKSQKGDKKITPITVNCNTLDNILHLDYRVDFLKIDVEGAELDVMLGGEKTIARDHPNILFECTKAGLNRSGCSAESIYKFLTEQHSYSIFLVKDFLNNNPPINFEQFEKALTYPFQAFNFIAIASS